MNSTSDVHRSVRSWAAAALGSPPWRVRLSDAIPVTPSNRPVAYVDIAAPARTMQASASVPQGSVQRMAAFTVMAFPAIGDTPAQSHIEADRVADLLERAVTMGVRQPIGPFVADTQPSVGPHPMHIPIFDFAGVSLEGDAAARSLPPDAQPFTWANVPLGYSTQTTGDPSDPRRFSVELDMQVMWWQPGAELPSAGTVAGVSSGYVDDDGEPHESWPQGAWTG